MYTDAMIDLETLGTEPDSMIITLGGCAFNLDTGEIGNPFYRNIQVKSLEKIDRKMDASTVLWWMEQGDEARFAMTSKDARSVDTVLDEFTEWTGAIRASTPTNRLNMWANDPDFDCVMLAQTYKAANKTLPWSFYENRSCRTMELLGKRIGFDKKRDFPREGTHHNAADDCIYQAGYVLEILRHLEKRHED